MVISHASMWNIYQYFKYNIPLIELLAASGGSQIPIFKMDTYLKLSSLELFPRLLFKFLFLYWKLTSLLDNVHKGFDL